MKESRPKEEDQKAEKTNKRLTKVAIKKCRRKRVDEREQMKERRPKKEDQEAEKPTND